jgi:hypothetical protein
MAKKPRKKPPPTTEEEARHDRWQHGRRVSRDPARALTADIEKSGWTERRKRAN